MPLLLDFLLAFLVGCALACGDFIESPPLRSEYSRRATERARSFTPERTALGYLEAYRDALGIGRGIGPELLETQST